MKRHKKRKGIIILVILVIGIVLLSYNTICKFYVRIKDNNEVKKYFSNEINNNTNRKVDYIGVIKIPKINLENVLYDIDSVKNNVNENIEIIGNSVMPDVINGIMVLAAHSGDGNNSFFRNLDKLDYDDKIYIYYNNYVYLYKIVNIYKVDKNGKLEVENRNSRLLVLTTCDKLDSSKQDVYISELIEIN